ncbi:hypothetical protein [Ohtaekwangia koreensis]|uniref:hypothetical protein n=1 Tax=Ohtaekwangia koreensis TaxID=688867 RepID=UPI0013565F3A|nr:hypothetical protein [Ohtaekwangia koreensis]
MVIYGRSDHTNCGNGIVVTFTSNLTDAPLAGIAYIDEGKYMMDNGHLAEE